MESSNTYTDRFDWISAGRSVGPDALCDIPIATSAVATAIPTLGAIVPNWILVIPHRRVLSLAQMSQVERAKVLGFAKQTSAKLARDNSIVYFEHGPNVTGSPVGCGLDHAHLHAIDTEVRFVESALSDKNVSWSPVSTTDPWLEVNGREYYFLKTSSAVYLGYPKRPTSQFFRKHIALAAGVPHQWDYKTWPNYENVRRTYERYANGVETRAAG